MYRFLKDTRTGKCVGPATPVYADDVPGEAIEPSEILWRYMAISKFEDMVAQSALYFARGDRFEDRFEGRFSAGNENNVSPSDAAFHAAYPIKHNSVEAQERQENARRCVFISCWHRAAKESWEMWNVYAPGPESVVITTTVHALRHFVPENIVMSPVKYHESEFPRSDFGEITLFFYKPNAYSFEREFRMLLAIGAGDSVDLKEDLGRRVHVPLREVIDRVITHPKARSEFKLLVDDLLRLHLPSKRREDSILLA